MKLGPHTIGLNHPFFLIAGPCVIESEQLVIDVAGQLKEITQKLNIPFVFKSSFDKANRSSHKSFRGMGVEKGLAILEKVKKQVGVMVLTDIHEDTPIEEVASVVDVLQTPAFLCRQTNYIQRVAACNIPVNITFRSRFLASDSTLLSNALNCFSVSLKHLSFNSNGSRFISKLYLASSVVR